VANIIQTALPAGASPFDAIRQTDEAGEFWSARDLQGHLGYSRWEAMNGAIQRASSACRNAGEDISYHLHSRMKMVGNKSLSDFRLSRYACYLVAMNGDPDKQEIAAAQTYFAVRTRQAELAQPAQERFTPWTTRLKELAAPHMLELGRVHPDRWSVVSVVLPQLLIAEDDLWRHGFPTGLADLPDGSVGICWANHRLEDDWPWLRERIQDTQLALIHADRRTGLNKTCQPWLYHADELIAFKRWFRDVYVPEKMPSYLDYLSRKDESRRVPLNTLAGSIDSACRLLTGSAPRLPNALRRALPAPVGCRQMSLFAEG
jgi:hypothetical protein